ncbi:hypothetical protein GCM10022396_38790 [Flavivirga amylovorans]
MPTTNFGLVFITSLTTKLSFETLCALLDMQKKKTKTSENIFFNIMILFLQFKNTVFKTSKFKIKVKYH